ncbi:hypothetical protein JTB14_004378 [Gonioctena quinquepunctata]|nr:hypothetical protein JTB14_004378 [Gonioctena quinquepunctata]
MDNEIIPHPNIKMDVLITIYGCLFLVGVIGNGALAVTLWWGRGSKSPLLLGLIIADFFVCCLSGPITAALYTLPTNSAAWLVIAQFMQIGFSIITARIRYFDIFKVLTFEALRSQSNKVKFILIIVSSSGIIYTPLDLTCGPFELCAR